MSELPAEFNDLTPVRKNQRYHTYKANYHGKPVFIKQVNNAGLANGVRDELWGLKTFSKLAEGNDLGFSVPNIITNGTDYIVTSWASGELIRFSPDASDYEMNIRFFASSLAKIDILTHFPNPASPKFGMKSENMKASIDTLKSHLEQTKFSTYFDPKLVDDSFQYVISNVGSLTARLTHADFTPGNVLIDGGQRTLIDYESVSQVWPRFYDLVNLTYNQMIMDPTLIPGCVRLVKQYFDINDGVDMESVIPQLNTIAMVRALSLIWQHMSDPNEIHNTQQSMTDELSRRLATSMEGILSGRPYFETVTA